MEDMRDPATDDTVELVDEEGVGVRYRLRKCGKRRLVIISLVLLLLVGVAIAVAVILTREPLTCKTAICYNISKEISNQLDKNVDPCDDFYSYACGGFIKNHPLSEDQSSVTGFTIVNDDNMEILRDVMKNAAANYSQSSSIVKTAKIYDSCIDTAAIEQRGSSPLENLITQYGGWTVTGSGLNSSWTVEQKMGNVLRDLNVQTLLKASVRTDLIDSSQHIITISYSSLGMGFSYYYDESNQGEQIRLAYKTYMKTVARLLGGGFDSDSKMMNIYNFESGIAEGVQSESVSDDILESLRDGQRSGRSVDPVDKTINDFCTDSTFSISFILDFLNTAFSEQKITFFGNENILYPYSTKYLTLFQTIADQYQLTADDTIKDYIMWRVVDAYVMSMPDKFVQAKLKYQEAVIGVQEYKRWSSCLQKMMTPMGMTLGKLYVDANFDETTKTTVKDMTSRLRQSFVDNLKSADWMDYDTKQSAKAKALAIKEDIGYPSYIKDDSKLDAHYSTLDAKSDLFENSLAMNRMMVQKKFGMLRQKVNKDMWAESPAQVNGYYSPQQNRIVFLAGILQSPFYRKMYPKYLNYGSLAMVIGHEITHGFDTSDRWTSDLE